MSDEMKQSLESVAKLGALMMAIILFFTSWKMITGVTGNPPGKYTAMMALINGPYSVNFWIGEVGLGMIIPFILILAVRGRNMRILFVASLAGMIGIFFMRYDLVIIGQLVPHYHGLGLVDYPELFTYVPSFHEWMITLGGIGFCGFLFLAGERLFRGHLSEDH
jgi:molybdopterin-containing oxidoreductase family membrane subunit